MKQAIVIISLIAATVILTACSSTHSPTACTTEAKLCPDGSAVGRVGPNCEFAPCPVQNTTNNTVTTNTTGCMEIFDPVNERNIWRCPQNTFKEYKSQNATTCTTMKFTCDTGVFFSDETGCGCVREHTPENSACTLDYTPVCGWFNQSIQCFAYPCAQTYGNLCAATTASQVAYTTPGECPPVGGLQTNNSIVPQVNETTNKTYIKYGSTCIISFMCMNGQRGFRDETGCGCEPVPSQAQTLSFQPLQCQQLPWDTWYQGNKSMYNTTPSEPQLVTDYYATQGISVQDVQKMQSSVVSCFACDVCNASYSLSLSTTGDTAALESDGWALSSAAPTGKLQATDCTGTRPEMCTAEYNPVCGQMEGTGSATYSNSCAACSDPRVISYTQGECN